MRRGLVVVIVGGALLGAATLGAGCTDDGDNEERRPPPEAGGAWERSAVWPRADVYLGFDRVAVGSSPGAVSWVTRRDRGDIAQLAYGEVLTGADATSTDLPVAVAGPAVLIPVGAAADTDGWAAVAATRDQPRGDNTGLVAWQARRTVGEVPPDVLPGVALVPPPSVGGAPRLASIGRANGVTTIAALVGGEIVVWSLPEAPAGGTAPWEASQPDLGLDGELVHLQVTGDGERFVLAGVDEAGRGHLWTSRDGRAWQALSSDGLPDEVGAVGLLTPLDDDLVAIGWLAGQDSAPANATNATIQRLEGERLTDEGVITGDADDPVDRLDLGGATLSPDGRLVVAGAALRANGDRSPMLWAHDRGGWVPTSRPELTSRLDYELRAVATLGNRMLALVAGTGHVDVETWLWHPPDS